MVPDNIIIVVLGRVVFGRLFWIRERECGDVIVTLFSVTDSDGKISLVIYDRTAKP